MAQTREAKRAYSKAGRDALKKLKSLQQATPPGSTLVAGEVVLPDLPIGKDRKEAPAEGDPWHVNLRTIRPALAEAERLVRAFMGKFGSDDISVPVLVTIGSGGKKATNPERPWLAHAAKNRWSTREGEEVHEIVLYAEHLNRPVEDIAETIMHECVHVHNYEMDEKDTASGGYRHNQVFQEAADAFGLATTKTQGPGYVTSLTAALKTWLKKEFVLDEAAFSLFRTLDPVKEKAPRKSTKAWTCDCEGDSKITLRVPAGRELRAQCHICGTDFKEKGS